MNETHRLLRDYVDNGSEEAFREIVTRYIDLVYSVALRRVSGDAHRAQDVVQTVFSDLARKAKSLGPEVMLGGWLHRHSCFVASTICRTEVRRTAREKEAMDLLKGDENPSSWEELAPVLDDAIQELEEDDRNAITLRYVERQNLRAVGSVLGTSEDAAQKRVSRALERLRQLLTNRGIALSSVGLAAALETNALHAAPAGWAARVSSQALASAGAKLGLGAGLAALLSSTCLKIALVALVAAGIGTTIYRSKTRGHVGTKSEAPATDLKTTRQTFQALASKATDTSDSTTQAANDAARRAAPMNGIRLLVVSADSGKPIAGGPVELRGWQGEKFLKGKFVTDDEGFCAVEFPRETVTQIEITTRIAAFADTRLRWVPKQGDKIPEEYTLRLEPGTPIGGSVVDDQGQAVMGAKVGFNSRDTPERASEVESHLFSWIQVESDSSGHWNIDRIGEDVLRGIYGGAEHPEHVGSQSIDLNHDASPEADLRAGKFIFRLSRAVTVRGVVLDKERNPVSGANVLVGARSFSGSRETTAGLDGTFELKGVKPGTNLLTAQAPQFAPTTIGITAESNSPPFEIILSSGHILRVRVVNKAGEPVEKAQLWLDTMDRKPNGEITSVQADFNGKADRDGRIYWDQAPAGTLRFTVGASGYARRDGVEFEADGSEHLIVLKPGLRIYGTVQDAENKTLIPRFKITAGWPQRNFSTGRTNGQWSSIDRYTLSFSDGTFDYRWEEPVVYGTKEWQYIFRVTADGFAPFVTRVVDGDEGEAKFEIALKPSREVRITVLQPNGQPAVGAEVVVGNPMQPIYLSLNGFERAEGVLVTDARGEVGWQPDENAEMVYSANASGFATASPTMIERTRILMLKEWGRIVGTYQRHGQPVTKARMEVHFHTIPGGPLTSLFSSAQAVTDAQGRFEFPHVPPAQMELSAIVPSDENSYNPVPLKYIEVAPGSTSTVDLADGGSDVVARLRWPEGRAREKGDILDATIQNPFGTLPQELMGNALEQSRWSQSQEQLSYLQTLKRWVMTEKADGFLKAQDVSPGTYQLSITVNRPGETNEFTFALRTITVTGDEPQALLDLGEIVLERVKIPEGAQPGKAPRQN